MDPISDFLNKLKLAQRTGKESFVFPASRFVEEVASALLKKGFIAAVVRKGKKGRLLEIKLIYDGKMPKIKGVKRISHLSQRVYLKAREIRPVLNGFGTRVFSTPKGILSDMDARKARVGGEVLFEIW